MMLQIKDIASIKMGYSFRGRVERTPTGNVSILQMNDLDVETGISFKDLMKVNLKNQEVHYAEKWDILFKSRGLDNSAFVLDESVDTTVITAPLVRIRIIDTKNVSPKYLCWFINQVPAQKYLLSRSMGTKIKMINIQTIEDMKINLPSLERQKQVVEISGLVSQEKNLINSISEKKQLYYSSLLMKSVKEDLT